MLPKGFTSLFANINISTNPDLQNYRFHRINTLRTHNYEGKKHTCKVYLVAEFGSGKRNGATRVCFEAFFDIFTAN